MNIKDSLILNKSIRIKKIGKRTVSVNIDTLEFFEHDKYSTEILSLVNGKRDYNEIVKILIKKKNCNKKDIGKDVVNFLNFLCKNKIILELKKLKNGKICFS